MKTKIALALVAAYLIGKSSGGLKAQTKLRRTIDYYEQELTQKSLYAQAMQWVAENAAALSEDELREGLRQRLLFMRIVTADK